MEASPIRSSALSNAYSLHIFPHITETNVFPKSNIYRGVTQGNSYDQINVIHMYYLLIHNYTFEIICKKINMKLGH